MDIINNVEIADLANFVDNRNGNIQVFDRRQYEDDCFNITDELFFQRYRFQKESIVQLHEIIHPFLNDPSKKWGVPTMVQLLVTLRFYATGSYHRVTGDMLSMSDSTVCRIIFKVTEAICRLRERYIDYDCRLEDVKTGFYRMRGFPGIIGCIDCTHVRIKLPSEDNAETYRNRKGYPSINVQMVCDHKMRFVNVVSRWPGSTHDSRIFNNSTLRARLERNLMRGILLGDGGYACSAYLLTPLLRPTNESERRYNTSHKTTRCIIERSFGLLKQRFRCLLDKLRFSPQKCCRIIIACCILHNFAISQNDNMENVLHDANEFDPQPNINNGINVRGNAIRAAFIVRHFQ